MDRRRILLIVAAVVAALGLALVIAYARGADARADSRYDTVEVYRAVKPIGLGETFDAALAAGKIEQDEVPRGHLLEGYVTEADADALEGQLAAMDIAVGEQITTAKFADEVRTGVVLPVPEGRVAQAVQLDDAGRVAGFASPGDSVAVLSVASGGQSLVLIPETSILGVGSSAPLSSAETGTEGEATGDVVENTIVTLGLTPDEALDLTTAIGQGATLTLVLRGDGVALERGQSVSAGDLP
ncbi:RcpC/CpaB family pilus assembly protein [Nocardioides zeae]|uniref:RcpC/CpaB family pilus assembly protein n=1 Tax=Nocardioides imazamoxiresistens TaxID=3231893 RepID=A0ABU3PX26_9ACTN|nr:RcpC/CpaB family pilus assembly protein [Nocardioides zeae]MDT9593786.1 RcpC/CpaB family pilus assembly protein [Nocardioides zeae]